MFMGLIPGIGAVLSLFHLAVLYALYSFEYKWIYQGKADLFETFFSLFPGYDFLGLLESKQSSCNCYCFSCECTCKC